MSMRDGAHKYIESDSCTALFIKFLTCMTTSEESMT